MLDNCDLTDANFTGALLIGAAVNNAQLSRKSLTSAGVVRGPWKAGLR
ncbi:pentapeptide repeat-containing protein [Amycolatopsis sp. GA6-003]